LAGGKTARSDAAGVPFTAEVGQKQLAVQRALARARQRIQNGC